jgi:hypothetical protein
MKAGYTRQDIPLRIRIQFHIPIEIISPTFGSIPNADQEPLTTSSLPLLEFYRFSDYCIASKP